MDTGVLTAMRLVLLRDLRVAFRRWGEVATPTMFFLIVTTLFPLALGPPRLGDLASGILWVAALLSSLLALDVLFRSDFDDGSMEQLVLSPHPLSILVAARVLAHWLISALPLIVLAPMLGLALDLPGRALGVLLLSLLLGTPTVSMIGAVGAALTAGLRRGSALLALLVLPLIVPVLIFGARATDMAARGEDPTGAIYLLVSLLLLSVSLGPLAAAAALRVSLE